MTLSKDIERFPVGKLDFGPGGKLVDEQGRTVCTINIKWNGLKLGEAMAYAKLFIAACEHSAVVVRAAEQNANKTGTV